MSGAGGRTISARPPSRFADRVRGRADRAVRTLIRHVAFRRYDWAKGYYFHSLRRALALAGDEVIVFTVGKVGSSSVVGALERVLHDTTIYHVHTLVREDLDEAEADLRRAFRGRAHPQVWTSQFLRERLTMASPDRRWVIITLVRDPIARNASAFFETLDKQRNFGYREKVRERGIDSVVEELKAMWPTYAGHDFPLTWFDRQLYPHFGVDVFATDFPKNKGYAIYRSGRADVLVIKLERLNDCGPSALREFLGVPIELTPRRLGSDKPYADAYSLFLSSQFLSADYVERMYSSRTTRHFYSEEELAGFRARWSSCLLG